MIAFLALTGGATLAGRAILRLSRADDDDVVAWLIAPTIGLAAAALLLGVTVAVGLPVRVVAAPFWAAVAGASIYAIATTRHSLTRSPAIGLAIAWLIALAMLAPEVAQGLLNYIGNPVGDGWSYIAYGNYLWELPNGTKGSLPPLQQYASHLAHTRYVASSLLAVVSPLAAGGGDTQSAAGPLIAATVFVFAASASAIAWFSGLTGWRAVVVSVLAACSPWVFGAIQVHNYDNLVALSFAPAIVIVAGSREWSIRTGIMVGWLLAAAVYAYVELSTFSAIALVVTGLRRLAAGRAANWRGTAAAAALVCAVCLLPNARDLVSFAGAQVNSARGALGARPGVGYFPALTRLSEWPAAFWGLSPDNDLPAGTGAAFAASASAWTCTAAALSGLIVLVRRRAWDLTAIAVVSLAAAGYFAAGQHYAYGAYKFVLIGWWVIALALVAAIDALWRTSRAGRAAAVFILIAAVYGNSVISLIRVQRSHGHLEAPSINVYRQVRNLVPAIGGRPLLLEIDDTAANVWAVYFLRDQQVRLLNYRGYMAFTHVAPIMDRAAQPPIVGTPLLLTDRRRARDAPAAAGPYALRVLPAEGLMMLADVSNPNGAEQMSGQPFFWIGTEDTEVRIVSTSDGVAELSARLFPGPSGAPGAPRRLAARSDNGIETRTLVVDGDGVQSIRVPVRAGDNRIYLRALDPPAQTLAGDPRPLMIGMMAPAVRVVAASATDACAVEFTNGWFDRETSAGSWWRWSSDAGVLVVSSTRGDRVTVRGEVLSLTRPNVVVVTNDGREVARWSILDPAWAFHPFPAFDVPVRAGRSMTLTFRGQAPARAQSADARRLGIAIKNLTVEIAGDSALCTIR